MELDYEGALLARLGLDVEGVSHVVYAPVENYETGEYADPYFSWAGCDCCNLDGATRGGSVYDVEVVAWCPSRVVSKTSAQICGECLCGLINGDWSGHE